MLLFMPFHLHFMSAFRAIQADSLGDATVAVDALLGHAGLEELQVLGLGVAARGTWRLLAAGPEVAIDVHTSPD